MTNFLISNNHKNIAYIKDVSFSLEGGYKKVKELLESEKDIDAIFCATYNMSLGD